MRILVGEISSYKAIVICKFFKQYYDNLFIVTYDSSSFSRIIHTKYSDEFFFVSKNNLQKDLIHIIETHKIDYFFPVINDSLSKLWRNKNLLKNTLNYLGDIKSYEILNDKLKLYELARKLEIKVPVKYENIESAQLPYVIKPTNLSSAKGVVFVNTVKDIPQETKFDQLIIQQYIEGYGVGYSFYCNDGVIQNGYGHRRLAEYPVTGGSSTYREGFKSDDMINISSKIVRHLNYTGFAMFEYKLTNQNEIYLIEVNPRIWGSINQGLKNGVNYFESILGNSEKKTSRIIKEKRTYLSPFFYLSCLKYILRFEFKPIWIFIKHIGKNSPDVSLLDDPKGYLSLIFRKIF